MAEITTYRTGAPAALDADRSLAERRNARLEQVNQNRSEAQADAVRQQAEIKANRAEELQLNAERIDNKARSGGLGGRVDISI
ncbi:hypothetical protein [Pannonibacter sp. SL95]|jgi:hypothetical protein|uniref:hypothetical protein n=1 Tax=Pannonibacter sp. SL95 TaxID=2995153 RepID=UPI0022742223|nr:hypothetical protein [Pannonibacter sp. SL95]MCY1706736.1 hypothetical protein [Pannonibacter sp. SL95]